jgi:phage terminase small subunit
VARARSPNRDKAFELWKESGGKRVLKDIAAELNVTDTQVRKWKNQDKWEDQLKGNVTITKRNVTNKKTTPIIADKDLEPLTEKQKKFVEEYVIDLNATQAAIRAGYSKNSARQIATENLSKPSILAYVKKMREQQQAQSMLDSRWVLERLTQVIDRSMQAVPVMEWDYGSQEMVPSGEYQYDSNGANKALELIGKHLGLFDPKAKHIDALTNAQIEKMKAETEKIKAEANASSKNKDKGTLRIEIDYGDDS